MHLDKSSIAVKLAGGFGICLLLMAALVGSNVRALQSMGRLYQETLQHSADMELAADAQHIGTNLQVVINNAITNRNLQQSALDWTAAKKMFLEKIVKVAMVADTPREQSEIRRAQAAFDDLVSIYEQEMLPLLAKEAWVPGPLSAIDARIDAKVETISLALHSIAKEESDENLRASREFNDVLAETIRSELIISLAGVIAAIVISILSIRRIVRPLSEVTGAAREMERGNYHVDVKHFSDDETGILANAFRSMAGQVEKRTTELEESNKKLRHEVAIRTLAEDEIRRLNAELEQRVSERTADLAATVISLEQEAGQRSKAEGALRESEKLLRVVLELLPVGIWVTGRGGENIVMGNRASKLILCGEPPCDLEMMGELKGWRPGTGKRLEKAEWALARAISGGETILNDIVHIECFDGSRKIVANSAVPIMDKDQNIIAAVELIEDITERCQAEERLRASLDQLRKLSAHLETARENERSRIAREIHDELGQLLTVLKFDIAWLNGKIPESEPALLEKTESMKDLVDTTIKTVQRIATDLRPLILDHLGLTAALEWYVDQFQARTGVTCELAAETGEIIVDEGRSIALFRIFQEGLTNVMRHADASLVEVTLRKKGSHVHLVIVDNGRGISRKELSDPKSVGLTGMRERAATWGGRVIISGVRNKGSKLHVIMPLNIKGGQNDQDNHSG